MRCDRSILPNDVAVKIKGYLYLDGDWNQCLQGFLGSLAFLFPARDDYDVTPPGRARVGLLGLSALSSLISILLDGRLYTVNWIFLSIWELDLNIVVPSDLLDS